MEIKDKENMIKIMNELHKAMRLLTCGEKNECLHTLSFTYYSLASIISYME